MTRARTTSARRTEPPRKRHRADVRRVMVLEAAATLIADEGLLAATMRRIAEASGVSLGTLTHHFPSVDDLLGETLEHASVSFSQELEAHEPERDRDPRARLLRLFEAVLPVRATAARQWRLWFQFWSRAVYDPKLARVNARRYDAWRKLVGTLLRAGIEAGQFRRDLDVAAETHRLVALMDGFCVAVALRDPGVKPAGARAVVQAAIDALRPGQPARPKPKRARVAASGF